MGLLLVALGIDNLGSGLFLPLTLVYATRVVGALLAAWLLTVGALRVAVPSTESGGWVSRRYLLLILLTGLVVLGFDFFLVGPTTSRTCALPTQSATRMWCREPSCRRGRVPNVDGKRRAQRGATCSDWPSPFC